MVSRILVRTDRAVARRRDRLLQVIVLVACASPLAATADDAMAPWASNHHPTDVAKRHVQEISGKRVEYVVVQRGTMDGRNCRSPQGVWQPFEQTWESNRSVRMENVGADRCGQSLALERPQRLPQPRSDRGQGHRAGHDRQREGQGPLVAGSPASLPLSKATMTNSSIR